MGNGRHHWRLSGGLASGKSEVRDMLAAAGIVTIDADRIGHLVLGREGPGFAAVAARWPQVVTGGEIDRTALAAIVFHDPRELAVLESITHPHIFDLIRVRVEEVDSTVIVEMPLLQNGFGDGWQTMVVDCRDDVRLYRAIERGMSESDARSRMASQPSREEWLAEADMVVPNHGSVSELKATIARVLTAGVLDSRSA